MPTKSIFHFVHVTAPDELVAHQLAEAILNGRLAACINIVPRVESLYWWQGKIEQSSEVLLLIKTTQDRISSLEKLVMEIHPYDTPEFVAIPIQSGSIKYLNWIEESVRSQA